MFYREMKSMEMTDSDRSRICMALFQHIVSTEPEFADIEPIAFARLQLSCQKLMNRHMLELQSFDNEELYRFALKCIRSEYQALKKRYGYR